MRPPAASRWAGGFGPALAAVALGGLAAVYFFLPPRGTLSLSGFDARVGLVLYIVVGAGMALLGRAMAASRRRAEGQSEAVARSRDATVGGRTV